MRRFRNSHRSGLYRSRDGILLGVCRGLAGYFDFSVFWARAIAVILLFFTGFWPVTIAYFIAALLMRPEPVLPFHAEAEQEFYDSYIHSRKGATDRIKRRYQGLERRIRRLESTVTSREFDWEHRFNN